MTISSRQATPIAGTSTYVNRHHTEQAIVDIIKKHSKGLQFEVKDKIYYGLAREDHIDKVASNQLRDTDLIARARMAANICKELGEQEVRLKILEFRKHAAALHGRNRENAKGSLAHGHRAIGRLVAGFQDYYDKNPEKIIGLKEPHKNNNKEWRGPHIAEAWAVYAAYKEDVTVVENLKAQIEKFSELKVLQPELHEKASSAASTSLNRPKRSSRLLSTSYPNTQAPGSHGSAGTARSLRPARAQSAATHQSLILKLPFHLWDLSDPKVLRDAARLYVVDNLSVESAQRIIDAIIERLDRDATAPEPAEAFSFPIEHLDYLKDELLPFLNKGEESPDFPVAVVLGYLDWVREKPTRPICRSPYKDIHLLDKLWARGNELVPEPGEI